ncbi:MAG: thiol reductant ABC exporter subunit CydC [Bacteroidales bacterium]
MIRKLFSYVLKYRGQFALALFLSTATILAGIGLMTTSGYLISRAAQRPLIVDLFMVTAGVRFFGISRAVVRYFDRQVSHDLTFKILLTLRSSLYRKFDSFSQKWMMGKRPGDLLSGIISDVETLQNIYLRIFSPAFVAFFISVITFFMLRIFDLSIALITLTFLLVNGIAVPLVVAKMVKGRGKTEVATGSKLRIYLVDRFQGLKDLIWMGKQEQTKEQFNTLQEKLEEVQRKNAYTAGLAEGLNNLLSQLAMYSVLVISFPLVISGEIKGVWLAAIVLGVLSSFEAVQGLANAFIHYENSMEAAKRLFAVSHDQKATDKTAPPKLSPVFQTVPFIAFKEVSFSYRHEDVTLSNISFALEPGSKTAIVGSTGSGKSTLLNLMLGFWQPDRGQITADEHDISHLNPEQYRLHFGVLAQDAYVFNRPLRENLCIADPTAADATLKSVLQQVELDAFSDQLDLAPGNLGSRFSGGERQLFLLAMLLLKKSKIWIFDEPTANMDVNTERRVMNTIWEHRANRTLIMITHRLIGMEKMDQILVMDKGRIAERGTHDQLMTLNKLYARMYHQQLQVIRD